MQQALKSRAVIDQAKGILMRDNRCTADEAFAMLTTQASNRSNRKLREIAQALVEGTVRRA
jgi:AmiR/NasT family two-component response regulator